MNFRKEPVLQQKIRREIFLGYLSVKILFLECIIIKTLLDELGLEPATTQKEFDELCTAIKEAGYTPLCFPAGGSYWMYQFEWILFLQIIRKN